jgi:hypothetical protein
MCVYCGTSDFSANKTKLSCAELKDQHMFLRYWLDHASSFSFFSDLKVLIFSFSLRCRPVARP